MCRDLYRKNGFTQNCVFPLRHINIHGVFYGEPDFEQWWNVPAPGVRPRVDILNQNDIEYYRSVHYRYFVLTS